MKDLLADRSGGALRHLGEMAFPYTSDLPAVQRAMVLERVGRRLDERALPDSRIVQIIMEETRFVEACM